MRILASDTIWYRELTVTRLLIVCWVSVFLFCFVAKQGLEKSPPWLLATYKMIRRLILRVQRPLTTRYGLLIVTSCDPGRNTVESFLTEYSLLAISILRTARFGPIWDNGRLMGQVIWEGNKAKWMMTDHFRSRRSTPLARGATWVPFVGGLI